MRRLCLLDHLKNLAEAGIGGPIATQDWVLWMRRPG
jgi:hypothetical protein